jgi:hypothetical protein
MSVYFSFKGIVKESSSHIRHVFIHFRQSYIILTNPILLLLLLLLLIIIIIIIINNYAGLRLQHP